MPESNQMFGKSSGDTPSFFSLFKMQTYFDENRKKHGQEGLPILAKTPNSLSQYLSSISCRIIYLVE